MITEKIITNRIDLMNTVIDDYKAHDAELNSLHFDFQVSMLESEILKAYAELQEIINGDKIVRLENGNEQISLIPENEFNTLYKGNCKDYLEAFNGTGRFLRYADEEIVEFIF